MSGPKVIRIVSLEEVTETCQILLAQVDAEIAEWTRVGNRNAVISKTDIAAMMQSRTSLGRMLELGQHVSLQKEAPLLIQKLRTDMDGRLEQAENVRVGKASAARSLQFTATTVLRQAGSAGIKLPSDTSTVLQEASNGRCDDMSELQKAISTALGLTKPKQKLSAELSAVSQQLAFNATSDTLDDWVLKNTDLQQTDSRFLSADKLIGQIRVIDEQFSAQQFQSKLQEISSLEESASRSLMLDSICLELKGLLTKASQWAALRRRLGELRVEADVAGDLDNLQSLFAQFTVYQKNGEILAAHALNERIQEALQAARTQKVGEKKRQALIQGLNDIGYVVNPGMSKVWTSQKQVVARSVNNASIGIELSGDLEAGRCQVRVVALDGGAAVRDPKVDKAQEEQWCGDLAKLQEKLASNGASLLIEKATAAGVVPLKVVKGLWSADFEERTVEAEHVKVEQKRAK